MGLDAQELIRYFRKNQVDTDQGMIQKVKGMSVDEAVATIRTKILQRFRGNEASTRAAFRLFDKDGGGEVSVRSRAPLPARYFCLLVGDLACRDCTTARCDTTLVAVLCHPSCSNNHDAMHLSSGV